MEAHDAAVTRGKRVLEHRFSQLEGKPRADALLHSVDRQAQSQLCDDDARLSRSSQKQAVDITRHRLVDNGAARQRKAHEHRRLHRTQQR